RGHIKANHNFLDFATYVCLFPQLVAGPIVRYSSIHKQLKSREITKEKFVSGIRRFIVGLAKKVLIANTFATIADSIFSHEVNELSTVFVWVGIISYSIQIYFDFSGYSDMAIGLGKMFGFDFPENFNFPYISKNIREFWQRWHISLSTWFRDYVYISLGGNRRSNLRTYINLYTVFFVTGLWHGASWNFIFWGLFHGTFLVIERTGLGKKLQKVWAPIQHLYTLLVVIVGWVFFRAEDLGTAFLYLKRMFWYSSGNMTLNSYLSFFHFNSHTLFFLLAAIIFSMPTSQIIEQRVIIHKINWLKPIYLLILFGLTITYLSADSYNPFIYFRF
ncbi:MBOAT family O-acyltransferase, partial [Xanthovirga aplysinae]|uniref:MBOAT family O-acyltransferase n=1 Tax=Xanthovirga aplysinae TaxID=2529853 RepID=UPI0012BBBF8C